MLRSRRKLAKAKERLKKIRPIEEEKFPRDVYHFLNNNNNQSYSGDNNSSSLHSFEDARLKEQNYNNIQERQQQTQDKTLPSNRTLKWDTCEVHVEETNTTILTTTKGQKITTSSEDVHANNHDNSTTTPRQKTLELYLDFFTFWNISAYP